MRLCNGCSPLALLALGLPALLSGCGRASGPSDLPEQVQTVTQVAYVALLFRHEHGRLPESMDEILSYAPTMPRTDKWGNEIKYQRERPEFTISSAGQNKKLGTDDDMKAILKVPPSE